MTKENFITKWAFKYNVNYTTNPYFIADLDAVIAHEVAKVKEQPQPDQVTDKVQNAKPFDKDRFERMFCAVVASEPHWTYKDCMIETEKLLTQLDAYYSSKNN